MELRKHDDSPKMAPSETARVVHEELLHWEAACKHSDGDIVVLNQRAFGHSEHELFLLSVAIKYAGMAKKTVAIAPEA